MSLKISLSIPLLIVVLHFWDGTLAFSQQKAAQRSPRASEFEPGNLLGSASLFSPERSSRRGRDSWVVLPAAKFFVENELVLQDGLENDLVLSAMMRIPREKFLPQNKKSGAYRDVAIPIGCSRMDYSPYITAYCISQLDPAPDDKVLEIGTGCGYASAVLSLLVREVHTVEFHATLSKKANQSLKKIGIKNVYGKIGDGFQGCPEQAPFDKIIVWGAVEDIPESLIDQLKEGGRMVVSVGEKYQQTLYLCRKKNGELKKETLPPTFFTSMPGEAESRRILLADPKNPSILGGDFEHYYGETRLPYGWYHVKNARILQGPDAPNGTNYMRFEVEPEYTIVHDPHEMEDSYGEPPEQFVPSAEKTAQIVQSFAIDGKTVSRVKFGVFLRAENIQPLDPQNPPKGTIVLAFYGEDREVLQCVQLASVYGSFNWKPFSTEIPVPRKTLEADLYIGLFQNAGRLDIDAVSLERTRR